MCQCWICLRCSVIGLQRVLNGEKESSHLLICTIIVPSPLTLCFKSYPFVTAP